MALKDQFFKFIKDNDLFNQDAQIVKDKFIKAIAKTQSQKQKALAAFDQLVADGSIKVNGGIVRNTKIEANLKNSYFGVITKKGNIGRVQTIIDGKDVSIFVPAKYAKNIPNNSLVSFKIAHRNNEYIALVEKVVKIAHSSLTGYVAEDNNNLVFVADDKRFKSALKVNVDPALGLKKQDIVNHKVKIELSKNDLLSANINATANITSASQILGPLSSPWAHFESAIVEKQIAVEFSKEVLAELETIELGITQEELAKRADYRHKNFVTIDLETTKDMDDAVYVEEVYENGVFEGFDCYIAISDVSHYIKPGTALDKSAFERGNSYYPADYVIPNNPEKLSNDICSLNPNVDRLVVLTKIRISPTGEVVSYNFEKAIINSKNKFSYQQVSDLYHNKSAELNQKFKPFKRLIKTLYKVDDVLAKNAEAKGKIAIKGYEPTILLNKEKTQVVDVINQNGIDSHRVIESLMVLNNEVVAKFLNTLGVAHVLRTHEYPDQKIYDNFLTQLSDLGIRANNLASNKAYQELTKTVSGHPLEKVISNLAVRSMQKAKYDINPAIGHFALGSKAYSHFTSPIRRYADLAEHRILFKAIEKFKMIAEQNNIDISRKDISEYVETIASLSPSTFKNLVNPEKLVHITNHLNVCEQNAQYLEGVANSACFALYMQKHIGQTMKGYVSYIGRENLTVTLKDNADPLHSDIIEVSIPHNGVVLNKMGDNVLVTINWVDFANRRIYGEITKQFEKSKPQTKQQTNSPAKNNTTEQTK